MYEEYIIRNTSSWADEMTFKCPVLANEELERRLDQGIEAIMLWPEDAEYDDAYTLDDIAAETGLTGLSDALRAYHE